jgi:hypothetical protein
MCYNLQLTLLSTFSKVKVKNNLSCGLLILTIDLILMERARSQPSITLEIRVSLTQQSILAYRLGWGAHLRERNRFLREIDCRFVGESFCRRTEET